jgi:2'-hydroxyisoflavone reductase
MKILVLGGTKFVGRAFVAAARERGHELTLFNRGRQDPRAWPDLEQVHGDRTQGAAAGGFAPLAGRRFDAVIDTAAYLPRDVASATAFFAPRADRYVLVSSISVNASHAEAGADESAPVGRLTAEQEREVAALSADGPIPAAKLGPFYGPLKALCEEEAERGFPGRALIVRPGLVVGPHDNTDRFTYWPARFMRGGTVLAPGRPGRPVQFIDVRDLAGWMVRAVEDRRTGVYLATGPAAQLTFGDVLAACARVAARRGAPPATLRWVDDATLEAKGVGPWMELPLWIPESAADMAGLMRADNAKAWAAGMTFRPLEETIEATLDWDATRPAEAPRAAGLAAAREAEILAALP